jgi:hypothetical protein
MRESTKRNRINPASRQHLDGAEDSDGVLADRRVGSQTNRTRHRYRFVADGAFHFDVTAHRHRLVGHRSQDADGTADADHLVVALVLLDDDVFADAYALVLSACRRQSKQ